MSGFFSFRILLSLLFSNGSSFLSSSLDSGGVGSSGGLGLSLSGGLDFSDGVGLSGGVDGILVGGVGAASGKTKHANDSESKDNFLHF